MNFSRPALLFAALILFPSSVHSQTRTVTAGPQSPAPAILSAKKSAVVQDLGQRKAIRGCPVEQSCQGPLQAALREFEIEAFPKHNSDSPWIRTKSEYGHSGNRSSGSHTVRKPSELRPDLPWLDDLKLPDVPVHWNHKIITFLEFYRYDKRGRNIMSAWIRDQSKYKSMMLAVLRKHRLPDALIYISMIESSYSPHEYSRVGASGLWQFMPAAGHIYGMTQNRWLDERNDPILSTNAVAYYFEDLYARFGDWNLALAAFNAGYGAVIKSIAKYNCNDYWQLIEYENGLPWGTSHYVPKFLAAAIVGHNLEVFGYDNVRPADEITYEEVSVPKSVALSVIARATGTTKDTIAELNPQLRKGRTPPAINKYWVRIPKGTGNRFAEKFAQLRSDWDDADAYVVRHGERFEDIAATHGISRSKLRKLNGLASETEVRGGMILVVPKVSEAAREANSKLAQEDLYRSGVPRAEDTEALLVAVPDDKLTVPDRTRHFYRVVSGDTLSGIASAFSVSRTDLASWNGLDDQAHLHPRMVLQVWAPKHVSPTKAGIATLDPARLQIVESGSRAHLNESERRIGRRRISYSPKRPESMETIAKKFGLGKYDLARINQKSPSAVIEPTEKILVYEVVDAKESDRAARQAKEQRRNKRKRSGG